MSLPRTLAILKMLATNHDGCTFSHLRTIEADLTAASLSRLLKSMRDESLVRKDEQSGRYYPGEALFALARELVGTVPIGERLLPVVQALAYETHESAAFFAVESPGAVLMAKEEVAERFHYIAPYERIRNFLGHTIGQVVMAWSAEEERTACFQAHGDPPEPMRAYLRRLDGIRAGDVIFTDLAVPVSPLRIAAPVFWGAHGTLAGVLAVTTWYLELPQDERDHCASAVRAAAQRATGLLGGR